MRYADDVSIYVKSERAGRRVLQSISTYLSKKLKLKVSEEKSRVDRPRFRSFLGFSIGKAGRALVSDKSIRRLKARIRELTGRNRGRRVEQIVAEVAEYLNGWRRYFNYAYSKQKFRELTAWIKRRLRCYIWKQWGRAGYRELRKRGGQPRTCLEYKQVASRPMAPQSQSGPQLRTHDWPFRRLRATLTPCNESVTETPCYVIRMAGVVGGDGS